MPETKVIVYLEAGHDIVCSLKNHLSDEFFKDYESEALRPVMLVEAGERSRQVEALRLLYGSHISELRIGNEALIDYVRNSINFWEPQFLRQIEMVDVIASKTFMAAILGADPRNSKKLLERFRRTDGLYPALLKETPKVFRQWGEDAIGPYHVSMRGPEDKIEISTEFLEEQAFCAWNVRRIIKKMEKRGYNYFVFTVGALHFLPMARYLNEAGINCEFYLPPYAGGAEVNEASTDRIWVLENLVKHSRNTDYLSLYEFFIEKPLE